MSDCSRRLRRARSLNRHHAPKWCRSCRRCLALTQWRTRLVPLVWNCCHLGALHHTTFSPHITSFRHILYWRGGGGGACRRVTLAVTVPLQSCHLHFQVALSDFTGIFRVTVVESAQAPLWAASSFCFRLSECLQVFVSDIRRLVGHDILVSESVSFSSKSVTQGQTRCVVTNQYGNWGIPEEAGVEF